MNPATAEAHEEVDYLEEPAGPGIPDLSKLPPQPPRPQEPAPLVELPRWERDTIEDLLTSTGSGLHVLVGAGEADWKMTQEDLERIAPPLTRICNRYESIQRVAPLADPLLVTKGVAIYTWRSALERKRALRDLEAGRRPAEGQRYVRTDEAMQQSAQGDGEEPLPGIEGAPVARASRMRSPAEGPAPPGSPGEEELPGEPADYDEPGMFNNGRDSR